MAIKLSKQIEKMNENDFLLDYLGCEKARNAALGVFLYLKLAYIPVKPSRSGMHCWSPVIPRIIRRMVENRTHITYLHRLRHVTLHGITIIPLHTTYYITFLTSNPYIKLHRTIALRYIALLYNTTQYIIFHTYIIIYSDVCVCVRACDL